MKIVVFDLDETLGYFTQVGIFWDCLQNFLYENENKQNEKLTQNDFNEMLDLFPEFIRPNIMNILQYLKHKKKTNCCHKLMIYTNNTGSKEWANQIKYYFENKINYKLIDQIIAAFKINGTQVEMCRTTHDKSHNDLIRCTKIPLDAEICFVDDTFHPKMANDNIYYINLKPYYYDLSFDVMIERFYKSNLGIQLIKSDANFEDFIDFEEFMKKEIKKYNYDYIEKTKEEYEIDKILGKHVLTHLQRFFNDVKKNKSRKNYMNTNMNMNANMNTNINTNSTKSKKNKTRKQI